jgi:predicted metal-dependent hydrolase
VSKKTPQIAALIKGLAGRGHDAHYLGYFECFNQEMFYEAHDVLEELWLAGRGGPNDAFYKALIQFAGAFVHLQKGRLRPAAALFRLAQSYLVAYPARHEALNVEEVRGLIIEWIGRLEAREFSTNPYTPGLGPRLALAQP